MRIGERDRHRLVMFLEAEADPGQRAPRTARAGEAIDPPTGLRPDLLSRRADVGHAVGGVVELVGPEAALRLLGDAA